MNRQDPAVPRQEGDIDWEPHPERMDPLARRQVDGVFGIQAISAQQPATALRACTGPFNASRHERITLRDIDRFKNRLFTDCGFVPFALGIFGMN